MYYIGLDVNKRTISYGVKDAAGHVHQEGKIGSTRRELDAWIKTLPQPGTIAMEATIFTGWIYDHLLPHAEKGEGGAPSDVACDSRGQEEERPDRCREDRRLPALRLPAGVLHDFHRDPGPAPDAALPEPCAEADGADEEPHFGSADGDRSELQQAAAAQAGLLHGTDVGQRRG